MTRSPPLSSLFARGRALLESPHLPLFAAILAALLTSPSVFGGFATEDWVQRDLIRRGAFPLPSHVNLFGHAKGWLPANVVDRNSTYQLYGFFPWLADPKFDTSFFRPLASLTHHLDYRLWPEQAWLMHVESVLWYAGLAAAVAVLHRRLVEPRWVAGFAALLYAVDDAHGHAVGWLINRNGVMASLFSVLALVAYDRYRRDGWRPGAWLTVVLFGLGLFSAEFALCAAGYFVAYVVFVDRAPLGRRMFAASAWLLPLSAWALAYRALGHTTHGSGLYIDPLADPTNYVFELFERGSVLLMGQLGAPFADAWTRSGPYGQGLIVFWAAMFLWFVLTVAWPVLSRDRTARFWATGLLLSLPPACATFPEDRLLFIAGIGAFPLIASFIAATFDGTTEATTHRVRPRAFLASTWLLVHALVAPLFLPYRSLHMRRYDDEMQEASKTAFASVTKPDEQSLIIVNGENYYFVGMMTLVRWSLGEPTTKRVVTLAGTLEDVTLRRTGEQRIEVRPRYGFLSRVFNRIYRSRDEPFERGAVVDLRGVKVTVAEINQSGEPMTAIFDFALPLENARYRWVVWRHGQYEPFVPPRVGATVVVHGS